MTGTVLSTVSSSMYIRVTDHLVVGLNLFRWFFSFLFLLYYKISLSKGRSLRNGREYSQERKSLATNCGIGGEFPGFNDVARGHLKALGMTNFSIDARPTSPFSSVRPSTQMRVRLSEQYASTQTTHAAPPAPHVVR